MEKCELNQNTEAQQTDMSVSWVSNTDGQRKQIFAAKKRVC